MTPQERQRVLTVLRAQHNAIDMLFAVLISRTVTSDAPFFPSKSGAPWAAMEAGSMLIRELESSS